jgi:hypothetical protein
MEPLRGDVAEEVAPLGHGVHGSVPLLPLPNEAADADRPVDADPPEVVDLVLDQRHDRVHGDAHTGQAERSELEGDGLPAAGRQEDERVFPLEGPPNRLPLAFPKALLAEDVPEHPLRMLPRRGGCPDGPRRRYRRRDVDAEREVVDDEARQACDRRRQRGLRLASRDEHGRTRGTLRRSRVDPRGRPRERHFVQARDPVDQLGQPLRGRREDELEMFRGFIREPLRWQDRHLPVLEVWKEARPERFEDGDLHLVAEARQAKVRQRPGPPRPAARAPQYLLDPRHPRQVASARDDLHEPPVEPRSPVSSAWTGELTAHVDRSENLDGRVREHDRQLRRPVCSRLRKDRVDGDARGDRPALAVEAALEEPLGRSAALSPQGQVRPRPKRDRRRCGELLHSAGDVVIGRQLPRRVRERLLDRRVDEGDSAAGEDRFDDRDQGAELVPDVLRPRPGLRQVEPPLARGPAEPHRHVRIMHPFDEPLRQSHRLVKPALEFRVQRGDLHHMGEFLGRDVAAGPLSISGLAALVLVIRPRALAVGIACTAPKLTPCVRALSGSSEPHHSAALRTRRRRHDDSSRRNGPRILTKNSGVVSALAIRRRG